MSSFKIRNMKDLTLGHSHARMSTVNLTKEHMPKTKEKTALGHVVKKTRKVKPAVWKTAQSLKPNTQLMDLLLLPKPTERCLAVQDAWAFHYPVTQSNVPVESDPQVIFAPDQRSSVGL